MGQDDSMEKSDVNDEPSAYVSCYPNTRRYSVADAMATNRPHYNTDNQGYSADTGYGDDEKKSTEREETKIDIPSPHPPSYSAVQDKMADKKVKVCIVYCHFYEEKAFDELSNRSGDLPLSEFSTTLCTRLCMSNVRFG